MEGKNVDNVGRVVPLYYNLESLWPDRSYAAIHKPNIKTDALRDVAASFFENMMRVDYLSLLPTTFVCMSQRPLNGGMVVYYNCNRSAPIVSTNAWSFYEDLSNPELFKKRMIDGMRYIENWSGEQDRGIQAWLSSLLLGTWTSFEAFVCDLWVATVNANPRILARLAGTAKRIHLRAVAAGRDAPAESRQENDMKIPIKRIHDLTNGTYDVNLRMGAILKSRVAFTRLSDVRRAYSLAFDEKKIDARLVVAVDEALADSALDALSAIRNLIIHKASIADEEYVKRAKAVNKAGLAIPQLAEGQPLQLDGVIVKSLVDPVVACCLKLFVAIDGWLTEGSLAPGYEAGAGI